MKILTAAQIGCGKFSFAQDFPNMTAHPNVNLKWACDTNIENAKSAAETFNVPNVTTDFMDVINDPEVDFIKIATSHEAHLPIIEAAAKAGKHIFCEKPMAMYDNEAFKIIRAVRRGKIKLCVDLNRRMSPALQALRAKWMDHGKDPQHNPWRYIQTERAPLPEENLPHLNIRIQDESSSYGLAHLDPLTGGGEIIGESVHWLDVACWFFAPARPVAITAFGSSRLSHGIYLKFDNGASMTLDFSCSGTFDFPKEQYEVTHNAALFRSLCFMENNYYGFPGAGAEYFEMQHGSAKSQAEYMEEYLKRASGVGNTKDIENSKPFLVDKGHRAMLDGFVKAIINDEPSPCDEMAGYLSVYLARRAIESLNLGMTLPLPIEQVVPCIV